MNRNETKLLVENWRKVLDEGLYDSDPEILEEIKFKQGLATAGLIASIFGSILGGASTADAKLSGFSEEENTAVVQVAEDAIESGILDRDQLKNVFKLAASAQSDKEVKLTDREKKQVNFLLDTHTKIVDKLQNKLKNAKNDFAKAYEKYNEYIELNPDATYANFDQVERRLSGDLESTLDELKQTKQEIKDFVEIHYKYKIETTQLPNGFEKTSVILDKNGNVAEVDGKKLYYVTEKYTVM